jgi:hypothetical protein
MTDGPDLQVLDELEARLTGALYADHQPRRVTRRRWLAPLGGGVAAATAAVVVAVLVSSGSVETPIAAALDRAARAVEQRTAAAAVGTGQFWYTRTSATNRFPLPLAPRPGAKLAPGAAGAPPIVWLVQRSTTETWVGLDGTVRTRTVPGGAPRFATPRDRARFLASGNPLPRFPTGEDATEQGDGRFPPRLALFRYRELVRLPSDPDALYQRIHRALAIAQARSWREVKQALADAKAQPPQQGVNRGIWIVTGKDVQGAAELDAVKGLLESPVPAPVRAALYRAAALVPGVRYDGRVTDALGRAGVGVSAGKPGSEFELIFDPATGALLGQHGPVVGDSATLAAGVVGSMTALPAGLAPIAGPAGLTQVAVSVRPAVGTPASAFTVRLRQPVSHGRYSFFVTGAARPACRPALLSPALVNPVRGSRAGATLTHRLRPLSTTGRDDRWCPGSYRVGVSLFGRSGASRNLATVRFRVR